MEDHHTWSIHDAMAVADLDLQGAMASAAVT